MSKQTFFKHAVFYMMLLLISTVMFWGCTHAEIVSPPDDGPDAATLSEIQTAILNVNCALTGGCHTSEGGGFPAANMDLSAGNTWTNIVNVPSVEDLDFDRVEPGEPENSYLYQKIMGTASSGVQMPAGGRDPLSDSQMDMIREWILDGAQDN